MKKHKGLKITGIILAVLIAAIGILAIDANCRHKGSVNPYSSLLLNKSAAEGVAGLHRIDDNGILYETSMSGNYEVLWSPAVRSILRAIGCSVFVTRTPEGDIILARNMDFPHFDKEGDLTGLNTLLHLQKDGTFSSINVGDSFFLSEITDGIQSGAFDDGRTNLTSAALLPWLCLDGMNEKGFAAAILALDLADGETAVHQNEKGRKDVIITEFLRLAVDSCETVEDAVQLAGKVNMLSILGNDYHLIVADAEGGAAVLEWRNNELTVTETDAVTNFYVGFDDACDAYWDGQLKEAFVRPLPKSRPYRYGYGHGYERFDQITDALDGCRDGSVQTVDTVMTEEQALKILTVAAQDYSGELTSFTQYSCLYNLTKGTVKICAQQDWAHIYEFGIEQSHP